ncbi:MAG: hypothetical protein AB8E82_05740 [Aureispira sp.]
MLWGYLVPVLLVIMIWRWWQLKRSIRRGDYDYRYYEEGPYGEKKKQTLWEKIRENLGI